MTSPATMIVELDGTGHRLYYVRLLLEQLRALGEPVVLVLSDRVPPDLEALHLRGDERPVVRVPMEAFSWAWLAREAADRHVATVVVPDADRHLASLLRAGGWRSSAELRLLLLRPPRFLAVHGRRSAIAIGIKWLVVAMLRCRPRTSVLTLESALAYSARSGQVPDPVSMSTTPESVGTVRERLGLDDGRYWYAVLGAVTARKNVPLVIEALSRMRSLRPAGLVVAGRIDPAVSELLVAAGEVLERHGCRLVVHDAVLSDLDLDSLVAAVDCVVLAHSNEGPSGLLGKAVSARTRVVAAGARSLRRDASFRPEEVSWAPLEIDELTQVLAEAQIPRSSRSALASLPSTVDFARALIGARTVESGSTSTR